MTTVRLIGLDADDTLWHNETFFQHAQQRLHTLLAPWADAAAVSARLDAVEHRNLPLYGYGVKGFTLSMLEVALELSDQQLPASVQRQLLDLGRDMMQHPVDLLPGVADALHALSQRAPLVLITKGDLHHQETKLAASGVGEWFSAVEIVSEKTAATYTRAFGRQGVAAEHALMAGNSVRSDVLPALQAGSWAALVPYALQWSHEAAAAPDNHPRYRCVDRLQLLVDWVDALNAARG